MTPRAVAHKPKPQASQSSKPAAPALASHDAHPIVQLQDRLGNRVLQRLCEVNNFGREQARRVKLPLLPKLRIDAPQSPMEREADRVAEDVLRMATPRTRVRASELPRHREPAVMNVPDIVQQALRLPGVPLDLSVRSYMEPRLGFDLSAVRVHTDTLSARSADAVNALAYTVGKHIVFAKDQYRPQSPDGRRLLAHELAHATLHSGETLRRTPGAGVDHVEVDCDASIIIFYQERRAYRYRLTSFSASLQPREYTATVDTDGNRLPFTGGSFEFELDNDDGDGNPFALFGEQSAVTVIVWRGSATSETTDDADVESDIDSEGEGGRETGSGGADAGGETEPRRGVRITAAATPEQRELALRVLRLIHGDHAPGTAEPLDTIITLADIDALRRLEIHPLRERILELLRSGRGGDESYDYANVLDAAIASIELAHFGNLLDYEFSTSEDGAAPLVPRPVHGRIEARSGSLVPGKEAVYEFIVEDRIVRFAVPHVFIRWFAARMPTGDETRPEIVESETLNYIDAGGDDFLTDRTFEVSFDEVGDYEIHAFVLHSFYQPAHFSIPVQVRTAEQQLAELEGREENGFGTVTSEASHEFGDVALENTIVRLGLVVAFDLPPSSLLGEDPDTLGTRRVGELSESMRDPASALRYIDEQRERVSALRDRYAENGQDDLVEWADRRLAELDALRAEIAASGSTAGRYAVAVDGYYVSNASTAGEGHLRLASWFTYDATEQRYSAVLLDYSELVRNQTLRFDASGDNLDSVYERLFFLLSSAYPSGRMRFSYQQYDERTPSTRFVQFERNTDTLLNDIQDIAFSAPVSIAVNVVSAILTVFPPTMAIGIGISLVYNGLDAGLNYLDASRSGTVSASNYVDLAMLAVDVIPIIGRAARLGETGLRVLRVGSELVELAGNVYVFTERAFQQIEELRSGDVQRLADLQTEINTLISNHAPADEIERCRAEERRLIETIRARTEEVFLNNAAMMGLQIASQAAARRAAHGIARRRGWTTVADVEALRAEAARRGRPDEDVRAWDEAGGDFDDETREDAEPDAIRRATEASVRRPDLHSDPILSMGLPEDLLGEIEVVRSSGEHGSVRVRAEPSLFGVGRIWIEAGQLATAADIGDHVAAVRLLQRYQGFSGSVRAALEYAAGFLRGLPPDAIRRARELRGEIEKLPEIIQRYGRELEDARETLTPEEIASHEARIRDLESQLNDYRGELAGLSAESRSVGYIAALDRLTERVRQDITTELPLHEREAARERLVTARNIVNDIVRRAAERSGTTAVPALAPATIAQVRTALRNMVLDPVFGRLALDELAARLRPAESGVRRRTRGDVPAVRPTAAAELDRAWAIVAEVEAQRQARHETEVAAREAVTAHRSRADVPDTGTDGAGTIAAGVLEVDGPNGRERVGEPIVGPSPFTETADVPIDTRYRKRRASGAVETFAQAIDHGEQTVLGRAARNLEAHFPDADPATLTGDLNMHVEAAPCFNCLAGLSGQDIVGHDRIEMAGAGPFAQFSREFPGIRIIVTFGGDPAGQIVIQNGAIVSGTVAPASGGAE